MSYVKYRSEKRDREPRMDMEDPRCNVQAPTPDAACPSVSNFISARAM